MDDRRKKIEQITFEILQKYSDSKDIPVDIVKIVRNMGFTVCEADFNDETESFVVTDKGKINFSVIYSNKIICVDGDLSWIHERVAIARELGYVLNNSDKECFIHKTYENDKKDIDLFAISLLIPADKLIRENEELLKRDLDFSKRTKILAQKFGVT